ncbi:hypothetical protein AcW1_006419 [Taiwanofungus camphoratus]|nr:hypothetical protein AcV5_009005 [Antrodia cinnamomea]KAI0940910.1 hypothetical protein AcV7_003158 [Antrodia cinnamomea]KAI0954565.1 hypothetical protein AcW1_006419 [Antrodia cinnamomea]
MSVVKLITVNTAPERARRLIGRVVEDLKDRYTILHVTNIEKDVKPTLAREQPDVMFTASMWTPEQAQEIVAVAKETVPGLKTLSLPYGLQVEKGPDAVVEYIEEHLPVLLETDSET